MPTLRVMTYNVLYGGLGREQRIRDVVRTLQCGIIPRWALRPLTDAGYVDCYRACNAQSEGFTVASWNPNARIDYVFASRGLETSLRSSGTLEPDGSAGPAPSRSLRDERRGGCVAHCGTLNRETRPRSPAPQPAAFRGAKLNVWNPSHASAVHVRPPSCERSAPEGPTASNVDFMPGT